MDAVILIFVLFFTTFRLYNEAVIFANSTLLLFKFRQWKRGETYVCSN